MQRIRERFRTQHIRTRFLRACLLIGIIPLIVMTLVSVFSTYRMTMARSAEVIATNLDMASSTIDIQTKNIENLARWILSDQTIQQMLTKKRNARSPYLDAGDTYRITEALRLLCINNTDASIYLFNWDGFKYRYRNMSGTQSLALELSDYEKEEWYQRTIDARGKECYFLFDVLQGRDAEDAGRRLVSVTKQLRDLKTNEPYGLLVINVSQSFYASVFPAINTEQDACYALIDARNSFVNYVTANEHNRERMEEVVRHYLAGGDEGKYLVTSRSNARTGWNLYHFVDKSYFRGDMRIMTLMTLAVLAFLIVISIAMSVGSSRAITGSLERLGEAINEVQRTGHPPQITFEDDEVGHIGNRFLALFREKEALSERVMTLTELEKEAELNAMQAQINPHFLYNTLSSVYWLAKFGRSEEAADMAITLSDIFKMVLNRGNNIVEVQQEIQHIERYLHIQNMRYNNRIAVEWQLAPEMEHQHMLKLILQPLVENAIYHGLESKMGEWRLKISGRIESGDMIFTVEDNGVGMDAAQAPLRGYGLRNVISRIRLKYGEAYGCTFESRLGEGTKVTVRIPCREEEK